MKTTIDGAGRIVIPKSLRDAAGIVAGTELEIEVRDGRIEIEPAGVPMRVVTGDDGRPVIEAAADLPPLSADEVRAVLESVRR